MVETSRKEISLTQTEICLPRQEIFFANERKTLLVGFVRKEPVFQTQGNYFAGNEICLIGKETKSLSMQEICFLREQISFLPKEYASQESNLLAGNCFPKKDIGVSTEREVSQSYLPEREVCLTKKRIHLPRQHICFPWEEVSFP